MQDTVLLESPPITEEEAARIECQLKTRQAFDNATGELEYNFVSGSLRGSWDEKVAVNVKRERWVTKVQDWRVSPCNVKKRKVLTHLEDCAPYVTIEGSVHKALMGHNVYGGPVCPVAGSRWFITDVGRRLGVELPDMDSWLYARCDWAEVFDLGSLAACSEFMHGMTNATYPRRQPRIWPGESFMFAGQMTTTKGYCKGMEFAAHDGKRLKKVFTQQEEVIVKESPLNHLRCLEVVKPAIMYDVAALQETANRYLRFEVEVRSRKLNEEFGGKPTIVKVTREWLEALHDREMGRVLREGKSGMETVRKHHEVLGRLHHVYGHINGRPEMLFGIWMQLAALGEREVKKHIGERTFRRYREQLRDANITWLAADVYIGEGLTAIPRGFAPVRRDPRRLLHEAPEVQAALQPFRLAA